MIDGEVVSKGQFLIKHRGARKHSLTAANGGKGEQELIVKQVTGDQVVTNCPTAF